MNRAPRISATIGLLLVLLIAIPGASAHHSAVMYDNAATKTLVGTVRVFHWTNPHAMLEFVTEAEGAEPGKLWIVEMSSPGVLTRAGWSKRTFNPGDRVSVELAPLKDGRPGGLLRKATLADGKVMTWSFKPGEQAGLQ